MAAAAAMGVGQRVEVFMLSSSKRAPTPVTSSPMSARSMRKNNRRWMVPPKVVVFSVRASGVPDAMDDLEESNGVTRKQKRKNNAKQEDRLPVPPMTLRDRLAPQPRGAWQDEELESLYSKALDEYVCMHGGMIYFDEDVEPERPSLGNPGARQDEDDVSASDTGYHLVEDKAFYAGADDNDPFLDDVDEEGVTAVGISQDEVGAGRKLLGDDNEEEEEEDPFDFTSEVSEDFGVVHTPPEDEESIAREILHDVVGIDTGRVTASAIKQALRQKGIPYKESWPRKTLLSMLVENQALFWSG
eukprot:jgi/Chlat1/9111/Chrsp97S08380